MDFWSFGIYIIIVIIAFFFVMLAILLMRRQMKRKGKRIYKKKEVYREAAGAEEMEEHQLPPDSLTELPVVENMTASPKNTNVAGASRLPNTESSAMHKLPASSGMAPKALESVALASEEAQTSKTLGPDKEAATGIDTSPSSNAITNAAADADTDVDLDTDTDEIETGDEDDPMGLFAVDDTEERVLTELAARLPDVNVNTLCEECADVAKMLRAKSNVPE